MFWNKRIYKETFCKQIFKGVLFKIIRFRPSSFQKHILIYLKKKTYSYVRSGMGGGGVLMALADIFGKNASFFG